MRQKIDCFVACDDKHTLAQLQGDAMVRRVVVLGGSTLAAGTIREIAAQAEAPYALLYLKRSPLTLGYGALKRMTSVARQVDAAMVYADRYEAKGKGQETGGRRLDAYPTIDYQTGSVRDDFDFGSLLLVKSEWLRRFASEHPDSGWLYAGWYELRLYLSRKGPIFHLNEYLYTEEEDDLRQSGEKQFDYVNPANRKVQVEMEKVVTAHLREVGALLDASNYREPDFEEQEFGCEASVVIPVFNREKTIRDAVESALSQQTSFRYNVIVVDNHSTDGTTEMLRSMEAPGLIHIIPERTDLGIGGCWNVAVNDERCGRFAVQLDSDDLYSSPSTLQKIVEAFHKQKAAMIVGSYRMCDFNLDTLPPGLIDHAEWTDENGMNNALRINGLGAPRAFFTPLLRQIQFPNTSYGEDYAMGLAFSRRYRIGRIFSELYLCRRWGGNSDAALSVEKVNANNLYKDRLRTMEIMARQQMLKGTGDLLADNSLQRFFSRQLDTWPAARQHFRDLQRVETKELAVGDLTLDVQFNPARIVSTAAKIDAATIQERPCFLCGRNRPEEQMMKTLDGRFELLVNPFPILPMHFTIPAKQHQPQRILLNYTEIRRLLVQYPDLMVFYNGPECGASAPDHMHFQAGTSGVLSIQKEWQRLSRSLEPVVMLNDDEGIFHVAEYPVPALLVKSRTAENDERLFRSIYQALPPNELEPMLNIVSWRKDNDFLSVVFPRKKHRPACYGELMVSPGALDMGGLLITPRREDFDRLSACEAVKILKEVGLPAEEMAAVIEALKEQEARIKKQDSRGRGQELAIASQGEPQVAVGIVSAEKIVFTLNKPYTAKGAQIEGRQEVAFSEGGILWNGNHYRELVFRPQGKDGSFSIGDVTIGVNFHWERKETQTFLGVLRIVVEEDKVCAINELPVETYLASVISSEMSAASSLELLKAHAVISRSWLLAQMEKRRRLDEGRDGFFSFTKKDDEMIRWYDREDHTIFDVCADDHCQRYQGITKQGSHYVEEAVRATRGQILTYGDEICDARFSKCCGGRTEEFQYCWENTPKPYLVSVDDPFCNTCDRHIISQVLNDYDQETQDFYRWTVEYTEPALRALIEKNLKMEFGEIQDLLPLERGKSGRIWKLKIVGSQRSFTIGKELEIRRVLSESHLYSSAFDVEKISSPKGAGFRLHGKGWGHGVGLCQIGAAVMGEQGYGYDEILLHYYQNAEIKKIYR